MGELQPPDPEVESYSSRRARRRTAGDSAMAWDWSAA